MLVNKSESFVFPSDPVELSVVLSVVVLELFDVFEFAGGGTISSGTAVSGVSGRASSTEQATKTKKTKENKTGAKGLF
jgi:hypothetical protein